MRSSSLILSALVGLAINTVPAFADQASGMLSFDGNDQYSTTTNQIVFEPGSTVVGGVPTGSFAGYFSDGYGYTEYNFAFDGAFTPGTELFFIDENGESVSFTADALSTTESAAYGLSLYAMGVVDVSGYDPTPATFTITTQDGGVDSDVVTYSATLATVPEPATVAMLGTGLLGFAGIVRRKFMA